MKLSTYTNPAYCLTFGNDTIFLNIEVEITRLSEAGGFKARIVKAQLDETQEAFPIYLLRMLTSDQLEHVMNNLKAALLIELEPSLFSLFYVGDTSQNATNTSSQ